MLSPVPKKLMGREGWSMSLPVAKMKLEAAVGDRWEARVKDRAAQGQERSILDH